jgi:hypothetical protein
MQARQRDNLRQVGEKKINGIARMVVGFILRAGTKNGAGESSYQSNGSKEGGA